MAMVDLLTRDQAPLTVQGFFPEEGTAGPLTASMAHVPELLPVSMPFIGTVLGPSSVDFRTKEIVILRTSGNLACAYCVGTHTVVASSAGLDRSALRFLRTEDEQCPFDGREALLVRWVDAVALGRGPIDAALNEAVCAAFTEAERVEITLLIGATMMLNRYATALDLPVSDDHRAWLTAEGWQ